MKQRLEGALMMLGILYRMVLMVVVGQRNRLVMVITWGCSGGGLCPLEDGKDTKHGGKDGKAEDDPCEEAAACPLAFGNADRTHERGPFESGLGLTPLGGLGEVVEENEGSDEPEEGEYCKR
jgi:hypothetical protein